MGTVERRHRHIVDIGITLLHHAKLPLGFWYYAFTTSAFLYNRVPTESLSGKSPYQSLFGEAPNLIGVKIYGSRVFPTLRPYCKNKFALWSKQIYVYLGCRHEHDGYSCFNPKNRKIIVSKDVTFIEDNFDSNPNLLLSGAVSSTKIVASSQDELCLVLTKIQDDQTQSN